MTKYRTDSSFSIGYSGTSVSMFKNLSDPSGNCIFSLPFIRGPSGFHISSHHDAPGTIFFSANKPNIAIPLEVSQFALPEFQKAMLRTLKPVPINSIKNPLAVLNFPERSASSVGNHTMLDLGVVNMNRIKDEGAFVEQLKSGNVKSPLSIITENGSYLYKPLTVSATDRLEANRVVNRNAAERMRNERGMLINLGLAGVSRYRLFRAVEKLGIGLKRFEDLFSAMRGSGAYIDPRLQQTVEGYIQELMKKFV